MNRSLVVTLSALLLATPGCGRKEESPAKQECQFESFDLSACQRSGLTSVKAEGVWHVNVQLGNVSTPGSMSFLPDRAHLFGSPFTERRVEADTFFLGGEYQEAGFPTIRFALAGCEAPAPERVKGEFRRCSNGEADLKGTFEAVRVQRREGEQERSGLTLVSESALPRGMAVDVFVAGGYAYVTALANGLFVFDVKDPAAPRKVAEIAPKNDVWHQAWVKDQTLYVASNAEGVILYDVSNPEAPRRLKALPAPSVEVWGLHVDQERLYAVSPAPRAEVLIYDIQKPAEPALLSRYYVEDSNVDVGELPVGATVFGGRLYLGHWRYGLAVSDVTDPRKPVTLGRFAYENATSRSVVVGTLGARTIAFESSEGWGSRVRALDVTDPHHITEVGRFEMGPESTVSGLVLVGSKLFVAHNQDGLRILEMSNPSTPRQVAYYNTWRETDPGRGRSFLDGLSGVKVPGDGFIYATETSRGLLVFREQD